jgi:TolA-binding protein
MKQGNYKDALLDGYLRTVVLFGDIKPTQPEALYKAAQCFDQLGQGPYAERMRKKLLADFPQDPYAQRVQSGK